jgi:integrase/recombinase XerD
MIETCDASPFASTLQKKEKPMIEHYFSRTSVITRLRGGLLGSALDDLATALHQQGYARDSIRHSLHACEQFGQWLAQQGYARQEVNEALIERYRRGLPRSPSGRQPKATEGLPHLLRLLQQRGMGATPPPVPSSTVVDHWLRRYEQYLDHILGVTITTRKTYLPIAKRFLDACCQAGHVDWSALRAQEITDFIRQEAATRTGGGRKVLTAAVRGFLRFLVFCDELRPGLEAAVPKLRHWTHATLPQRLTAVQVEQVLATCTGSFPQHLRNRAILLLLARLGLRAHDVLTLHLEDIDWRQGQLRLRPGKTHHERLLPLSQEVGHALARYLQHGRPVSASRRVFLHFRAPFRPFAGPSAISQVAKRAMRRAGIPDTPLLGAHIFRHSAASQMVNRGASFKEVADVLGHRSLQTTGIYAKLDLEVLASVALPWMGDVS